MPVKGLNIQRLDGLEVIMRNGYYVFDGNKGTKVPVYGMSDIHAAIWRALEALGFNDVQICDIIDNEMWTDNDVHIVKNGLEVSFR